MMIISTNMLFFPSIVLFIEWLLFNITFTAFSWSSKHCLPMLSKYVPVRIILYNIGVGGGGGGWKVFIDIY